MSFSIKNKAYLIKKNQLVKLRNECLKKVLKLKPLKCNGNAGEVHFDVILKKLGKLNEKGLFKVEYRFNKDKMKVKRPKPKLSTVKHKVGELAYDLKIPEKLKKMKTITLDIVITYDESKFEIAHLDAHEM
tara:strand:- start:1742 stop:2134 length:393 start_codon:yes stop_codon:yes gene_type:complete